MRKIAPTPTDQEFLAEDAKSSAEQGLMEETDDERILRRPDGFHWLSQDGRQEFGPFETEDEAWADMNETDEEAPEPGETLEEAENEIGISDWIDPDTGEPAEGQSLPRLDD